MSIRTALGALPAWPALVIAPLVILGIGAMSYGPAYQLCTRLAEARAGFSAAIERAAQAGDRSLRLDQAVADMAWDQVRILQDVQADGELLDCPFGWDLTKVERRAMIAQGQLGILAFAEAGEVVDYVEFRSDLLRFEVGDEILTREAAVFTVETGEDGTSFVLRPVDSKP